MIKAHKGLGEKLTFNKSVLNSRQSAKKKKKKADWSVKLHYQHTKPSGPEEQKLIRNIQMSQSYSDSQLCKWNRTLPEVSSLQF